jgi:hypothetical protein
MFLPRLFAEMLKPFSDDEVGYVSAPSICDKNAATVGPREADCTLRPRSTACCRLLLNGWRRSALGRTTR